MRPTTQRQIVGPLESRKKSVNSMIRTPVTRLPSTAAVLTAELSSVSAFSCSLARPSSRAELIIGVSIWKVVFAHSDTDSKPVTSLSWISAHLAISCRPARVNIPATTRSSPSRATPLAAARPRNV